MVPSASCRAEVCRGSRPLTDKILHQGPGYTIAISDVPMLGVPYRAEDREDGDRNHGFIDLRDNPDLVLTIPEAEKNLGLAAVLRAVNAQSTPFMTVGCECGLFEESNSPPYVGSYIGIAFREADSNQNPSNFERLAISVLRRVNIAPPEGQVCWFEFIIEPLRRFYGAPNCFHLVLKMLGSGPTPDTAWAALTHAGKATATSLTAYAEHGEDVGELPQFPNANESTHD
jgi:hypothetical protein